MKYYLIYEYALDQNHSFLVEILDINISSAMLQIYQRKRFNPGSKEVELKVLFTNIKDTNTYLMANDPHQMQLEDPNYE